MTVLPKSLLIIPFYNECERISIGDFIVAFKNFITIDFLLVDDGSTDKTATLLQNLEKEHDNVSTLILNRNVGKAEAIRSAILKSDINRYDYIGYLDADLATPVEELIKMLSFAEKNPQYQFIMGSRIKKMGSTIIRYKYRHYFGRIFATIVSSGILKTPVYDTQCGAKVIARDIARQVFEKPFLTRWLFDIELLLRFQKNNPHFDQQVYEFSLNTWIEKGKSKITLRDLAGFPLQLLKIYNAYD